MAEQKQAQKKKVAQLLQDNHWITSEKWVLTREEMEWLLQVLNDVRVGSWVILGAPDTERGEKVEVDQKNIHFVAMMELCGLFQSIFLAALKTDL